MAKPIDWRGSSLEDVREFPVDARSAAGFQLRKVQQGEPPDVFKPMSDLGSGVVEIIVDTASGWFRVMYVAKFEEAVYVLHAFQKKTNKTSEGDKGTEKTMKTARRDNDLKSRHVTPADGNVFEDLGFAPKKAKALLREADARIANGQKLKQETATAIAKWMQEQQLTQVAAAEILEISRPRVSDLVNFKLGRFSLDTLIGMLLRAGKDVELVVR